MSTRIRMALVMNLLPLLFLAALGRSDQNTSSLTSFKINEKMTYDCIDIHKQPALDHPLLKNHKIQMKPSVSRHELKNQTGNNNTYRTKIRCPDGTVPILRNTEEYNTNAQLFAENHLHPLSADSPGTHIAGVRLQENGPFLGVEALFNTYELIIGNDQASYSQIYVGSGLNNEVNYIETGMMINPSIYGDSGVWSYGYWKGKDGKGCYNTACSGFIHVSKDMPIVGPIVTWPKEPTWLHRLIYQDKKTGNWWLTNLKPDIDIGYWPKDLFNLMGNGANMVGVGGVVQASARSGLSPPMGNGKFPVECCEKSGTFTNIKVVNAKYVQCRMDSYPMEVLLDSKNCYGLKIGPDKHHLDPREFFFNYGGPGGDSCGV